MWSTHTPAYCSAPPTPMHSQRVPDSHLEVLAVEAPGQLPEERQHDLLELGRLRELQDLLELPQEQHLLLAVGHRPELEHRLEHRVGQLAVLLHKLRGRERCGQAVHSGA